MSQQADAFSTRAAEYRKGVVLTLFCAFFIVLLFWGWSRPGLIMSMDRGFFAFFGNLTQKSWAFDTLVVQMFTTHTAKMVPLLACVVWLLSERRRQGQSVLFLGYMLVGSFVAMLLSRVLQNFSIYRPRPLHNLGIEYQLPFGVSRSTLEGWSSFPSDTTALGISIAAAIFVASRRLGLVAFSWALIVVAFPRAYAGLHYPSDLLGGLAIGLLGTLGLSPLIFDVISRRFRWNIPGKWMPLIWTSTALYMFQLATMFNDVRAYGSYAKAALGF